MPSEGAGTDGPASDAPPEWRRKLRRRLLAWYAKEARDLPWRRNPSPYRVWVSEVMLQQTQVETVRPYFDRFLQRFPTVEDLADADEQEILRLWEGLGYYRRARGLHAAAKVVVAEHGGEFPTDLTALQKLPGIGRYTAGAILSIACDQPAPILEANTIRLFCRLIGCRDQPTEGPTQKRLWAFAEEVLPRTRAGDFNQALMELGALVCTPKAPKCGECPVAGLCAANLAGAQETIPAAKPRKQFEELREAAVLVRRNGAVLLRLCGESERWAGLWDFPRFPLESEGPLFARDELASKVQSQTGVRVEPGALVQTLRHGVTRYRITLDCYEARYAGGRLRSSADGGVRWVPIPEIDDYPLNTTARKLAKLLSERVS
ncbi:MAG: A/G-specific adenine glycosylase [Planctomycetota bacterium]